MQVQKRGSVLVKNVNHMPQDVLRWKEKKQQFRRQAENMNKLAILFKKEK